MTEDHANDGELYRMIMELRDENRLAHADMIEAQKLTNGRVSKLEKWQAYILGGLTMLGLLNIPARLFELLSK